MASDGQQGRDERAGPRTRGSRPTPDMLDAELAALERESRASLARGSRPGTPRRSLAELEADLDALHAPAAARAGNPTVPTAARAASHRALGPAPRSIAADVADYDGIPAVFSLLGDDGEIRSALPPPPPRPAHAAVATEGVLELAPVVVPMREPTPVPVEPDESVDAVAASPIPPPPRIPTGAPVRRASGSLPKSLDIGTMAEPSAVPPEPGVAPTTLPEISDDVHDGTEVTARAVTHRSR